MQFAVLRTKIRVYKLQ